MRILLRVAFTLILAGLVYAPLWSQADNTAWEYGVVKIKSTQTGSGFVVGLTSEGAWIVTVEHVVGDAKVFHATFHSDEITRDCGNKCPEYPGRVHSVEKRSNPRALALLLVPDPPDSVRVMRGQDDRRHPPRKTPTEFAGYPKVGGSTYHQEKSSVTGENGKDLHIKGSPAKGYSGGPLVLNNGQVAGVIYRGFASDNMGLVIGTAVISDYLSSLRMPWPSNSLALTSPPPATGNENLDSINIISISPSKGTILQVGQKVKIQARVEYNLASATVGSVSLVINDVGTNTTIAYDSRPNVIKKGRGTLDLFTEKLVTVPAKGLEVFVPLYLGDPFAGTVTAAGDHYIDGLTYKVR